MQLVIDVNQETVAELRHLGHSAGKTAEEVAQMFVQDQVDGFWLVEQEHNERDLYGPEVGAVYD